MSPREAAQNELREHLVDLQLDEVYGVIDAATPKHRSLTFCKAEILDGVVYIYGPKFILVKYQTAIRTLPHRGQEKFESVEAAKEWFTENFGRYVHV